MKTLNFSCFLLPKASPRPEHHRATGEPDRQLQHFRQPARSSVAVAASRETWKKKGGLMPGINGKNWKFMGFNGISWDFMGFNGI